MQHEATGINNYPHQYLSFTLPHSILFYLLLSLLCSPSRPFYFFCPSPPLFSLPLLPSFTLPHSILFYLLLSLPSFSPSNPHSFSSLSHPPLCRACFLFSHKFSHFLNFSFFSTSLCLRSFTLRFLSSFLSPYSFLFIYLPPYFSHSLFLIPYFPTFILFRSSLHSDFSLLLSFSLLPLCFAYFLSLFHQFILALSSSLSYPLSIYYNDHSFIYPSPFLCKSATLSLSLSLSLAVYHLTREYLGNCDKLMLFISENMN